MNKKVLNFISSIQFKSFKEYRGVSIVPLFLSSTKGPFYITLDEAVNSGVLKIKEVDTFGSVPELVAENKSEFFVLILDGEEVIGAKQNRVLNTTILLDKMSKTVIPVSCVEAHRWRYVSEEFSASKNILSHDIRREKQRSVIESLKKERKFMSDQEAIWERIDEISNDLGVDSTTGAMNDIYNSFDNELNEFIEKFPIEPSQNGIFVFIDGKIVGFDIISRPEAYQAIHSKLVKSYCLDVIRQGFKRKQSGFSDISESKNNSEENQSPVDELKNQQISRQDKDYIGKKNKNSSTLVILDHVKDFLEEIKICNENHFKSPGLGRDYRYESKNIVGSALVYDDTVIHMSFFRIDDEGPNGSDKRRSGRIASYRDRVRNRNLFF